jgi:hypothetical protein
VLEQVYGYRNMTLACQEGESIVGIMPLMEIRSMVMGRRAVSLPFSDICQPLLKDNEASRILLRFLSEEIYNRRWKYIEIRGPIDGEKLYEGERYKRHVLQLHKDKEKLFETFHLTRTRQSIKKFYRIGGCVERRSDPESIRIFMNMNYLTRQKHGIPPQPDSFFRTVQKELISKQMGFVSIAVLHGENLAASVFLHFKNILSYKFSASDEDKLRFHPNHGILWDAIQQGIDLGCTTLDFGRSDMDREGLITFKRSWGTVESGLQYMNLAAKPPHNLLDNNKIVGRLRPYLEHAPIGLLKIIGKVLYRHIG